MYRVSQSACLLLYLAQLVILGQSTDLSGQLNSLSSSSNRDKRETDDDFEDNVAKRSRELVGKRSDAEGITGDETLEKRLMPYDELEKRLRHFIGKRTDDEQQFEKKARSRGRYFLGKRTDDDDDGEKRARYFLGKRDDEDIDEEKRYRYFLGKRDTDDLLKRRYYFLGKRPVLLDDDFEKRRRFFLGKRRRFFLGKRDSTYNNDLIAQSGGFGEGSYVEDSSQNGLRDFIQKRMRYFLGKRSDELDGQNLETEKRFARHFLGR
ncbi:protein PRQFV-amide-like [Ylistrum balloti]|uniref:protein PRQFV-amide-like n=1 Tax=Ylistrum balloti TaxID=509963 RepID=UPI002905BFE2|nr:protein PRQFV-amide-like [Ylistrum balloti]